MLIFYENKLIGTINGNPSEESINVFVEGNFQGDIEFVLDVNQVSYEPENDNEFESLIAFKNMPRSTRVVCQKWAANRIKSQHAAALKLLSGNATTEERDTWPIQLQAAQAFTSGKANDVQKGMLDALLLEGESKTALSQRIVAKNTAMQTLIGMAGGLKRQAEQTVESASSVADIKVAMVMAGQKMETAIADFKAQMAAATA